MWQSGLSFSPFVLPERHLSCCAFYPTAKLEFSHSFRTRNFHRLRHRNEFVHQIVIVDRIGSFLCDVILVISRKSRFMTFPFGFVSFHNAGTLDFLVRVSVLTRYSFP